MPKYGPHLPEIEKKVQGKIAQLGLVPSYAFDCHKHQERFYTAVCRDKTGGKVIFKMRTEDWQETQEAFRREIRINRLFAEVYGRGPKLAVPHFIAGDCECVPEWMVYEFIPGEEAGDFYNGMLPETIEKVSIASLVEGVGNIQKHSILADGNIQLRMQKSAQFKAAYEKHKSALHPFFSPESIRCAGEIIGRGADLLDKSASVIAHGDLHPGNMVLTPTGEIAIIDWYYVHLNNAAFDIAFLYLEIADEAFRRILLERFVREFVKDREGFCELFRLNVLRLVPYKLSVLRDSLYVREPRKEDYERLAPRGMMKLERITEDFSRALAGKDLLGI